MISAAKRGDWLTLAAAMQQGRGDPQRAAIALEEAVRELERLYEMLDQDLSEEAARRIARARELDS